MDQQEWSSGSLGSGTHTLILRHASGYAVDIDAIVVVGPTATPSIIPISTATHTNGKGKKGNIPVSAPWDFKFALNEEGASETPTNTSVPTITPAPTEPTPEPLANARYFYDGDGAMVKSLITSTQGGVVTTFYPGRHYTKEINGTTEKISHAVRLRRKYYTAETTLVAVRTVQGGTDTVQWLLSDHLNSTSVTATPKGALRSPRLAP